MLLHHDPIFYFHWFGLDGCAVKASGAIFLVVPVESAAIAQFDLIRTAQASDA
jgi:hypothetical protein